MDFEEIQDSKKRKLDPYEINSVPDEIWLKILNYLDQKTIFANFALVCKRFHNLTLDSSAVKHLNFSYISTSDQYENCMKILKRYKALDSVQIENCPKYCNDFISQAFESSPKLKSLIVESTMLIPLHIVEFGRTCLPIKDFGKDLENLVLGNVRIEDQQIEMMTTILSLKNLKSLEISLLESKAAIKFLDLLPKNCLKLSEVSFHTIIWKDLTKIQAPFDNFFEEMQERLKKLKIPPIIRPNNRQYVFRREEEILMNLSLCQKLEVLELGSYLSNDPLTLISKLPNLKHLKLGELGIFAGGFGKLFLDMNTEKLEFLHIDGTRSLFEDKLQILSGREFPNLKEIRFSNCRNLDLREITLEHLKDLPKLEKIGLQWLNVCRCSLSFLQEFNEQISINVYDKCGKWKEFDIKAIFDYRVKYHRPGNSNCSIMFYF